MKSWYELTKKEAIELEHEFLTHEVAKEENKAMHIQVIIGASTLVLCTTILTVITMLNIVKWYIFIILLLGILLGILLVVLATIEYHKKLNSYLEIKHKIIKK